MNRIRVLFAGLLLGACLSWAGLAQSDSWAPPRTETTLASKGDWRVTVVPRPIGEGLFYFQDKVDGVEPAGQRKGDPQKSPIARVERRTGPDNWQLVWQKPLVNDVAPPSVLLADGGTFLVTFDNWHSAGYGDDVVVIYDRRGTLIRKLSLEEILPAAWVHHLPRTVSSRWWGSKHRLVEGDRQVELNVVAPGSDMAEAPRFVPVRIRLADGVVIPPAGTTWDAALREANALEAKRMGAWEALRRQRIATLHAPVSKATKAWLNYLFEVRSRVALSDERMGGKLLAAPGETAHFNAEAIAGEIDDFDPSDEFRSNWIFASPTSGPLADVLVKALNKRKPQSMRGARIAFVGTAADGTRVREAARKPGATIIVVDSGKPVPPGKPLPATPPELWMPPYERD
jgi:hypothetical protein